MLLVLQNQGANSLRSSAWGAGLPGLDMPLGLWLWVCPGSLHPLSLMWVSQPMWWYQLSWGTDMPDGGGELWRWILPSSTCLWVFTMLQVFLLVCLMTLYQLHSLLWMTKEAIMTYQTTQGEEDHEIPESWWSQYEVGVLTVVPWVPAQCLTLKRPLVTVETVVESEEMARIRTHYLVAGLPKKSGQCPYLIPATAGSCDYECRSDLNCKGTAKCCSNGCGTQCVEPLMLTGGWGLHGTLMLLVCKNHHHHGLYYYTLYNWVSMCLMANKRHFALITAIETPYPDMVVPLYL
jgi:hypothetical protein